MREQLNEVWFAVHTLREQDPDGQIYNRWDDVCGALAQIAEALGHEGFIAEDPTDGRQRLSPSELIPVFTKALQELSAKNDALEARIKKLEDG